MDVSEELTEMAGGLRSMHSLIGQAKRGRGIRLLLDRVDVLTPNGKERLRAIRDELGSVTDRVAANIPWG